MLLQTVDKTNPVYRLLIPVTHDPYAVNESASIALLGQTGACNWFNFTRKGLVQYYESTKRHLKIRDLLIPKRLPGPSPIHEHQHLWFDCIHNFASKFLSIQPMLDCDDFLTLLKSNYDGIYDHTQSKRQNWVDICAMMIYSSIVHECYSNPTFSKLSQNPFSLSSTWKQHDSSNLREKINNLGEQTQVNFVSYSSGAEAIRLDDERWIYMCCVNEQERRIYADFRKAISKLSIPEDAILHPKNISSSISY